jgi:hypothetical protein
MPCRAAVLTCYGKTYVKIALNMAEDGTAEIEYFKFRCFANRNLHLEFKRLDLVAKLNAVAGGMRLRSEPEDKKVNAG